MGPRIAESVASYFGEQRHVRIIERLKGAGLRFAMEKRKAAAKGVFSGKTFVLTGALAGMSRNEAKEAIEAHGGKVVSAVSKQVTVLVVGEDPGSKLAKATKLGLEVWDENRFLVQIGKAKG